MRYESVVTSIVDVVFCTLPKRLSKYHHNGQTLCLLCNIAEDDQLYRFVYCTHAQKVWKLCNNLSSPSSICNMNDWLMGMSAFDKDDIYDLNKILILCWQMWNERNNFVVKQIKPNPTRCLMAIATIGKENQGRLRFQAAPLVGKYLHKVFISSILMGRWMALLLLRIHRRQPSLSGARHLGPNAITVVNAHALRDALVLAKQRQIRKIVVERDSKVVVDAILKSVQ
ncbi:hypothetical protein DVH24_019924 [Malus domestica]|uniref:RNase H type-1 domain-containing protein n=1 Tax=Malus domestica TaxID=3750 RepID=A0A498I0A3_MALDO|nr:hypothetical protein DVH24_019924 [Malus domestica]